MELTGGAQRVRPYDLGAIGVYPETAASFLSIISSEIEITEIHVLNLDHKFNSSLITPVALKTHTEEFDHTFLKFTTLNRATSYISLRNTSILQDRICIT
jgi:hypothetical protein